MERILVRFPSPEVKLDVLQSVDLPEEPGNRPKLLRSQPDVLLTPATDTVRARLQAAGAKIFEDVQFSVLPGWDEDERDVDRWTGASSSDFVDDLSLQDVIEQIRAPEVWPESRGEGVTIAIVDTGITAGLPAIAAGRRSAIDLSTVFQGQHWADSLGHGSMCAAIAAGSRADGGRYDGVAPGAAVLAARSSLKSTDLADIYDELIRVRNEGSLRGPLVVSNSYGLYTCDPPKILPEDHPYVTGILTAIDQGVFVCFAAGNCHHDVCRHDPTSCGPNSIWGPNSHDRIVSVGTVNRDLTNCDPATPHVNSSRGPGEWASTTTKPDCVAPTYGEVPWGTSFRRMRWWGTSGACPQVAGLAALILSIVPELSPDDLARIIKETCSLLPEGRTCVGHGAIDCASAVEQALSVAEGH